MNGDRREESDGEVDGHRVSFRTVEGFSGSQAFFTLKATEGRSGGGNIATLFAVGTGRPFPFGRWQLPVGAVDG